MERMMPKVYQDLLRVVSVIWIGLYPHQVIAEGSLCHLNVRPQPYSLKEEVGDLVWEYPPASLQWNTDRSRTNVWKRDKRQKSLQKVARAEEGSTGMVPEAGAMELEASR